MTRIQIAKDITMADTVHQLLLPGKTVVLLTGNGHADHAGRAATPCAPT